MRMPVLLLMGVWLVSGCASAPPPGVVVSESDRPLESIPGPFAKLGPETDPDTAIIKACPVIMALPNAFIPVDRQDMNFKVYWGISTEYCAWQYSPDGHSIWTSLFATSTVQGDSSMRRCGLPPTVLDGRYPGAEILYLTILHNHMLKNSDDNKLSRYDFSYLREMVAKHYLRMTNGAKPVVFPRVNGKQIPMRIVAFFGKHSRNGLVECAGFFEYTWGAPHGLKATQGKDGHWHKEPVELPEFDEIRGVTP